MPRNSLISLPLPAVAALAAAGLGFGAAPAQAEERRPSTTSGTGCLWAGTGHTIGTTVVAGGRDYTCAAEESEPAWAAGAPSHHVGTVANPGSAADPSGSFSSGARQPGTAYNDYCVGNQLVEGTGHIYQVVRANDGRLFWLAAEPIGAWHFDRGTVAPQSTWRSSALCYEGNLA